MSILWGLMIMAVGLILVVCGSTQSEFIVCRLMVARSRILWAEKVYRFHQVAGVMVIVFGLPVILGYVSQSATHREVQGPTLPGFMPHPAGGRA